MAPTPEVIELLQGLTPGRSRYLPGPEASLIVAMQSPEGMDGLAAAQTAFRAIRTASARDAMAVHGLDFGFRIEDAVALTLECGEDADVAEAWKWLDRQLPRELSRRTVRRPGAWVIRAVLRERCGQSPRLPEYRLTPGGIISVEAFELHVVEHCNLRCANCCNLSPFVDAYILSAGQVGERLRRMARFLHADVFKIMGGEPLLHPDLPGVLREVKASGIGDVVRLFSNGLLLPAMKEDFWASLDQLTISSYSSAPVKSATLALAERKSLEYGFVLNCKPVDTFSQVLSPRYEKDQEHVQAVYDACWLRHRCLIERRGRFFKCTRAAYASEFHSRVEREPPPPGFSFLEDGVDVDAPDLANRLLEYLNSPAPLASCRYCHGGSGPLETHHQLSPAQRSAGHLSDALGAGHG